MKRLKMKQNEEKGMLIAFCGIDGSGKTTMINRVKSELAARGDEVFLTRQPTDFMRKSEIFRTYMDCPDHSAFSYRTLSLWAAGDRIQHTEHVIEPALREGKTVICDRYFYSCLANLRARGYNSDKWIYEISSFITKPDITFFLDLPTEKAVDRVRARPEEKDRYIDMMLLYRLREQFLTIARENGCPVLSTEEPESVTFEKIMREINRVKENRQQWKKK